MLSPAVLRSEWTALGCELALAFSAVSRDAFPPLGDGGRHLVSESEHFPENPLSIPDRGRGRATSGPVPSQYSEDSIHGYRRLIHVVMCPVSHYRNVATAVSIQCLSILYTKSSSRLSKYRNIDSRRRRKGKLSQGQQIASTSPRAAVGDGASGVHSPIELMVPLTE